jgi:hypothetical protein
MQPRGMPALPYTPAGRPRPGVVTGAVVLLYFIAAAQFLTGALGLLLLDDMRDAYEAAYGSETGRGPATTAVIIGACFGVLLAAGYSALGYLNGRGSHAARVTTWVILGLSMCCFGGGVLFRTSPTEPRISRTLYASRYEITSTISEMMPWYYLATFGLSALSLLAAILVVVLLALPPANRFFRRLPPQPYAGPAYPNPGQPYPGPPAYPGQPYTPSPYPGQQYPGQPYGHG